MKKEKEKKERKCTFCGAIFEIKSFKSKRCYCTKTCKDWKEEENLEKKIKNAR